jgi:hypothetical protein
VPTAEFEHEFEFSFFFILFRATILQETQHGRPTIQTDPLRSCSAVGHPDVETPPLAGRELFPGHTLASPVVFSSELLCIKGEYVELSYIKEGEAVHFEEVKGRLQYITV